MPHSKIQVTAALIEKQGCYLIALRPFGDENGGLWEFPGGKIKPGETPKECLKREIREELGIEIEVLGLFASQVHKKGEKDIELLAYKARWIAGEIDLMDHAALRWIEPSSFHEVEWSPADVPIAERLRERGEQQN
jgi:8-oxo-dGTP diphosphatase